MSESFQEPLSFQEIKEKTEQYVLGNYKRAPVAFYFGQGEYLYDTENKRYIDFLCGIAVTSLGHGEADLIEAIREQADRLIHTSNIFYNQEQALLAEVLIQYSFPGKVFFCNSGTEANEAAFKLARRFGQVQKGGATGILSLENSFHGRTAAAMSLTGQAKIHSGFGPLVPGVRHIPANDIDLLEKEISENSSDLCALFLELIQGESGVRPLDAEYVRAARELTEQNDILLIVDEVQTGIGRTGKLFAFEHYGIQPDAVTLAKALGGGFPVGAMIVADAYAEILGPGMHGSTFGGNHLAARVGYETLRILMGREILKNVEQVSSYMMHRLNLMKKEIPSIVDVRGMGLHIGLELDRPCAPIVDLCRERRLLVNCTADSVIRILPPLNIGLERAEEGLDILEAVLRETVQS